MNKDTILKFDNLTIEYIMENQNLKAVNNVSFEIKKGKVTAFVGESGSGKTTLVSSLLSCITKPGKITNGTVIYTNGNDVIEIPKLNEKEINKFRWEKFSVC